MSSNKSAEELEFMQKVGINILTARRQAKLSQKTLADTLKVSRPRLSRIENGNSSITVYELASIARQLEAPLDKLLKM